VEILIFYKRRCILYVELESGSGFEPGQQMPLSIAMGIENDALFLINPMNKGFR